MLELMFLLKDNAVTLVRLEPVAPRSQVKHSTTELPEQVSSNGPGLLTKMATTPIYGKIFTRTGKLMTLGLGM